MDKIDFTNCPMVPGKAYGGSNGRKIPISYNNENYMLKFPPKATERHRTDLSYINDCISEHICCSIFNSIGISAQSTILGTYTVEKGKEKIVCACKDFETAGKRLLKFLSVKNLVVDSEGAGRGTELANILKAIELQDMINEDELLAFYCDMFVVDAFVGNFDRHNNNWGILYDSNTSKYSIAPVYDCGSCLLPRIDEYIIKTMLSSQKKLNAEIYNRPKSIIQINNERINYFNYISSLSDDNCNSAILRVVPKIDFSEISRIIDDTEDYTTDLQKEFYKKYLKARYDIILMPALRKLQLQQERDNQPPACNEPTEEYVYCDDGEDELER
jgi:hypothetical protein